MLPSFHHLLNLLVALLIAHLPGGVRSESAAKLLPACQCLVEIL